MEWGDIFLLQIDEYELSDNIAINDYNGGIGERQLYKVIAEW